MRFTRIAAIAALVASLFAPLAAVAGGINLTVGATVAGDATSSAGAKSVDAKVYKNGSITFTTGSGAGQAAKIYTEAVSISASGSESDDLTSLTDVLGAALSLADVKAVYLVADGTNTNSIVVGNAASNQFAAPFDAATDTVTVPPGGVLLLENPTASGWTVDSTHKLLKLANSSSGTAVTGTLIIVGN